MAGSTEEVSGYLLHKPAGALARLKGRRRQWYVFDESGCRLVSYKNESDARTGKPPVSTVSLKNAAITLLSEEKNSFVIHSEGKEHVFVADDHESMMVWALALQAKRDSIQDGALLEEATLAQACELERELWGDARTRPEKKSRAFRSTPCRSCLERKVYCLQPRTRQVTSTLPPIDRSSVAEGDDEEKEDSAAGTQCFRGSTSSSEDVVGTLESRPVGDLADDPDEEPSRRYSSTTGVTSDCETDSDPADTKATTRGALAEERTRFLRMANARVDCFRTQRAGSMSGASVSSDSAIGLGDSVLSMRLQDLEAELMATKCELAKALNRETSQKNELVEREDMLALLHEQVHILESSSEEFRGAPWKSTSLQKMNDRCRMLQSHNRFLNEEVLKLSRLLQQLQADTTAYKSSLQEQVKEIDQLKRDYVFLMQSAIRIRQTEGPENFEVYLYGGDRHSARVLQLLKEARKMDPSLPTYDRQSKRLQHTDALGFRHSCAEESLSLHYLCRRLHQHYRNLMPSSEMHLLHWNEYLDRHGDDLVNTKELKSLVRNGIPDAFRSRVWRALFRCRIRDIADDKGNHYYSNLCRMAPESEVVSQNRRQISLDLLRTLPNNVRFADPDADGIRKLQEVLQAFCLHNPTLGYCQGMNFLVGMCLLFIEPEDAFWCLVAITERYFAPNYFDHSLVGAQADQEVLKNLLQEKLPRLHNHLTHLDIELCTVTLNWFLAIFFDSVPFETLLRIWDCFLLEGPKVLFRFSLAILKMHEEVLLTKHDTVSIMRQLKSIAKLCFDADALIQVAFESLEPFPRRQDIATRQACYQKTLRELAKKRQLEKQALYGREEALDATEVMKSDALVIECAAVCETDKVWLCHGNHGRAFVSRVSCEENIMYRLNIDMESRVTCMHALSDDTVVFGTLSHFVYSYSTRTRKLKWEAQVNDSVLSLCSHEEGGSHQVYAGLADGTMAVLENFSVHVSKPDCFYIQIGSSPVTCMRLVDKRIWCACGNRIVILSARTLDTVDQFQVSSSTLDYISLIQHTPSSDSVQGVWLSIRGSSVVQLWDPQTLTCKLLYDVRDDRYPKSPRDEDNELNQARITALLPLQGSVLVGTAEGFLIFYDVVKRIACSDAASAVGSASGPCSTRADIPKDGGNIDEDSDSRARKDSGYMTSTSAAFPVPPTVIVDRPELGQEDVFGASPRSVNTVVHTVPDPPRQAETFPIDLEQPDREYDTRDLKQEQVPLDSSGSGPASPSATTPQEALRETDIPPAACKASDPRRWSLHCALVSSSMQEYQESVRRSALQRLYQKRLWYRNGCNAMSTDCIPAWIAKDTPSSSFTSDSYDFDDLFTVYKEDADLDQERALAKIWCLEATSSGTVVSAEKQDGSPVQGRKSWSTQLESSSVCSFVTGHGNVESSTTQDGNGEEWMSLRCDNSHLSSDAASSVSLGSFEPPYSFELLLQEKIKISDKAIRCLLEVKSNGETAVVSGAGCYGDDEAILKWTKEGNESDGWTNCRGK